MTARKSGIESTPSADGQALPASAGSVFPWDPIPEWMFGDSVEARNALQNCGRVHPYTCGNDSCRATLRAVETGWICDHCGYEQSLSPNVEPR